MSTFLAYLGRLFMILLGFSLAVMAAATVFTAALVVLFDSGRVDGDLPDQVLQWAGFIFLISSLAGTITLLPVAILALLAELFSWRSLTLYGVLGAALGTGAAAFGAHSADPDWSGVVLAGAAAGIVGASVYWLVAGRRAGLLLDRITAARRAVE